MQKQARLRRAREGEEERMWGGRKRRSLVQCQAFGFFTDL
jgi:hypothetical protein